MASNRFGSSPKDIFNHVRILMTDVNVIQELGLDSKVELSENDEAIHAHIVDRGDRKESAQAMVLQAMIEGTPITALCGYTWIPSRDPKKYPLCKKCEEIFEFAKDFRGV